jgi:hypothetical protein
MQRTQMTASEQDYQRGARHALASVVSFLCSEQGRGMDRTELMEHFNDALDEAIHHQNGLRDVSFSTQDIIFKRGGANGA